MELHYCLAIWSCELSLMEMTLSLFLWMSCLSTIFYPVVLASINDACLHQLIYWRRPNCDFSYSIISFTFFLFFSLFAHILLKEKIPPYFSEYHHRLLIFFFIQHFLVLWHSPPNLSASPCYLSQGVTISQFTYPAPDLEPSMSVRNPGFFEWEMVFRNKRL